MYGDWISGVRAPRAPPLRPPPGAQAPPRGALVLRSADRVLPPAARRLRQDGRRRGLLRAQHERNPASRSDAQGRPSPTALRVALGTARRTRRARDEAPLRRRAIRADRHLLPRDAG